MSTMTSSSDDHHHNDASIQVGPEQYRGLDATSYTARRLVRIELSHSSEIKSR